MRGRKPTPLTLVKLAGNPGRRPLPRETPEPPGELEELTPPEWMTDSQRAGWRHALANAPRGLLRNLDGALLAIWVVAEDMHREASMKLAKFGMVVRAPKTEVPMQSPYLSIKNKQAEIMMRAASELGFTPSARARLAHGGATPNEDKGNRFAKHGRRPA